MSAPPRAERPPGCESLIAAAAGVVLWLIGLFVDPRQALFSWLFAFAATLPIAWGALALLMIGHLVRLRTLLDVRAPCRRIAASFAGVRSPRRACAARHGHALFRGCRRSRGFSPVEIEKLAAKDAYLDPTFFVARAILYVIVWIVLFVLLRRAESAGSATAATVSDERLHERGPPPHVRRTRAVSAAGLIALAFTAAFAAIDWLMSLTPLWLSSLIRCT